MAPMTISERVVKKMMTVFNNSIKIHDRMRMNFGEDEAVTVRKPLVTKFMTLFNSPDLSTADKSRMLFYMLDKYDEYAELYIRPIFYRPEFLWTASHLIALMLADPAVDVNEKNDAGYSTALRMWKFADDHEVLNNNRWSPIDQEEKAIAAGKLTEAHGIEQRKRNAAEEKRVVIKRALLARDDLDMLALQKDDGDLVDWLFMQYVEEWMMGFINHPNFNVGDPENGAKEFLAYATKYERHTAISRLNELLYEHGGEKENTMKR